jgi:acetoacetyl-CoA synthetase
LFVATPPGTTLDDQLRDRIRAALRRELSPRHVPDAIEQVPAIPRTMTGKKLETPIKKILLGKPVSEVVSADAVTGFEAIAAFRASARPT